MPSGPISDPDPPDEVGHLPDDAGSNHPGSQLMSGEQARSVMASARPAVLRPPGIESSVQRLMVERQVAELGQIASEIVAVVTAASLLDESEDGLFLVTVELSNWRKGLESLQTEFLPPSLRGQRDRLTTTLSSTDQRGTTSLIDLQAQATRVRDSALNWLDRVRRLKHLYEVTASTTVGDERIKTPKGQYLLYIPNWSVTVASVLLVGLTAWQVLSAAAHTASWLTLIIAGLVVLIVATDVLHLFRQGGGTK